MNQIYAKVLSATSVAALLSACGGGGSEGVLSASSQALIGVNATTLANPQVVTLVETTANTSTGLSADFGGYTFEADRGFEDGTAVENGNSIGLLNTINLSTQTDLRLFDGAYDDGNGVVGIYYGISGIAPSDALPASGSATWTGSGFAEQVTNTQTNDLGVGTAVVSATFPGSLSATISGLSGNVDEIRLPNLTISGDRFTGSTVFTSRAGNSINLVGANATGKVNGIFSGAQTVEGTPDEVGGLFSLTGSDATIIGGFVAD